MGLDKAVDTSGAELTQEPQITPDANDDAPAAGDGRQKRQRPAKSPPGVSTPVILPVMAGCRQAVIWLKRLANGVKKPVHCYPMQGFCCNKRERKPQW